MSTALTPTVLTPGDIDRVIEMAWEDRTPFDAIEHQFGLSEEDVITLMRRRLKRNSFKRWRARVGSRRTKHRARRDTRVARFVCPTQHKS